MSKRSIVATSDTHWAEGQESNSILELLRPLADKDAVLIHAGDLLLGGTEGEWDQRLKWMKEAATWFRTCIFVPGNHDRYVERRRIYAQRDLQDIGWEMLTTVRTIEGIKYLGFPFVTDLPDWAFNASGAEILDRFYQTEAVHGDTIDVVIAHSPPRNCLDGYHYGTQGLEWYVAKAQPALVICGHVHESYGTKQLGKTLVANVCMCDIDYKTVNPPMVFEFDTEHRTVVRES